MNNDSAVDLPKGIHRLTKLPDSNLRELWDSIVLDDVVKERLLAHAIVNFTVRSKVPRTVLPLHGLILLVGKPGTGKTSLARGLASRVANAFNGKLQLVEVEPHSLSSSAMGRTQKAVSDLFGQVIAEYASDRPTIVLLDEVETLAADRSKMSLEANPVDVHRATDAVLVQLDLLAEAHPNLLFVATSNFPEAVDSAFLSRCDLIETIPLPDAKACAQILRDCLEGLAKTFTPLGKLTASAKFEAAAAACVGLDGRTIRKVVASAIGSTVDTAANPEKTTMEDIIAAARGARSQTASDKGRK